MIFIDDYTAFMTELHNNLPEGVDMYKSKTGTYYYTNCSDPSIFSDFDI